MKDTVINRDLNITNEVRHYENNISAYKLQLELNPNNEAIKQLLMWTIEKLEELKMKIKRNDGVYKMKQVRESNAAKSLSAYVIFKKGEHIATVQAYYANSGGVSVDVWDKHSLSHQGKAGGYGYDKFTAALSGAVIDGVKLYDHCGGYDEAEMAIKLKAVKLYQTSEVKAKRFAAKHGLQFANWRDGKPTSAFFESGLNRLSALGYTVISAI